MRTATRGLDGERPGVNRPVPLRNEPAALQGRSRSFQKCFTQPKTGTRLVLRPLRFPISALRLAVALEFRLTLDGFAADFACVLDGELIAHALAGHFEGDFAVLELPFF